MEYNYGECETCGRKGDPYCIGCMPTRTPDGKFSRSLYTPHNGRICFTTQITVPANAGEGEEGNDDT